MSIPMNPCADVKGEGHGSREGDDYSGFSNVHGEAFIGVRLLYEVGWRVGEAIVKYQIMKPKNNIPCSQPN